MFVKVALCGGLADCCEYAMEILQRAVALLTKERVSVCDRVDYAQAGEVGSDEFVGKRRELDHVSYGIWINNAMYGLKSGLTFLVQ